MMRFYGLVSAVALVTAALFAGCGGDDGIDASEGPAGTVNGAQVAGTIEQGIQEQLGLDMTVDCPDDENRDKGARLVCVATTSDDDDFDVKVRQTNDRGGVDWDLDILPTEPVEESIASEIFSARAVRVTLDCPVAVQSDPGYEFTCTAEDAEGRTQEVFAKVADTAGNVTWRT